MNLLQHLVCGLIRLYQAVAPPLWKLVLGPGAVCRFEPSCSHYGLQAIQQHGVLKGGGLAARRVCRCHPWGSLGFDPVPPAKPSAANF